MMHQTVDLKKLLELFDCPLYYVRYWLHICIQYGQSGKIITAKINLFPLNMYTEQKPVNVVTSDERKSETNA
jgi:hypothetical protein